MASPPVAATCAGLLSGAPGAFNYYDPLLRPIAHILSLWLVVVIAVTAQRPLRVAIRNAMAALVGAVLTAHLGA